jgi:hypothetical protein
MPATPAQAVWVAAAAQPIAGVNASLGATGGHGGHGVANTGQTIGVAGAANFYFT